MIFDAPAGATSVTLSTRRSIPVVDGQVEADVTADEVRDLDVLGFTPHVATPAAPAEPEPDAKAS